MNIYESKILILDLFQQTHEIESERVPQKMNIYNPKALGEDLIRNELSETNIINSWDQIRNQDILAFQVFFEFLSAFYLKKVA